MLLKDLMWFLSLFKCACCHAYVVLCAICVACSVCGLVNYVFSHAFFLERTCFLVPASAWVYDLTLWLAFSSNACVVLRNYRLDIVHAAITDLVTVFLLKVLCSLWLGGKCLSIRHRKLRAMFVLTFLLNGALNQMILRCLFLRVFCGACFCGASLWSKLLCLNAF